MKDFEDRLRRELRHVPGSGAPGCPSFAPAHRAECVACAAAFADAGESDVPAGLARRIENLGPAVRRRPIGRPRSRPSWIPWAAAAAAAVLIFILIPKGDKPQKPRPPKQTPEVVVDEKPEPPPPDFAKPEDFEMPKEPEVVEQPKQPEAVETPEEPEVVEVPKDPETPKEPEVVEKPKDPVATEVAPKEPEAPAFEVVQLASIRGVLRRGDEPLPDIAEVRHDEVLSSGARNRASFMLDGATVRVREGTRLRVEKRGGELRLRLEAGEVEVAGPVHVATEHAEASVVGTVFVVRLERKQTVLMVVEGKVRFHNARGEVEVEAGHVSVCSTSKPSKPKKFDPAPLLAWTRDPQITDTTDVTPLIDSVPTGVPGCVVSNPYSVRERQACDIGRRVAEELGWGIVAGYHYRNDQTRIWRNIDRPTEKRYDADGNRGNSEQTKEAAETYEAWRRNLAVAAGKRQADFIVTLRNHSEPIRVIEMATLGIDGRQARQMKATYDRLLDELGVDVRYELRIDQLDAQYEYEGATRTFTFTESDAKTSGFLDGRDTRRAAVLFFPSSRMLGPEDEARYARIVAELVR